MKSFILLVWFLLGLIPIGYSQNTIIDSLSKQLAVAKHDTTKVLLLSDICYWYRLSNPDTAFQIGEKALELAKHIKYVRGEANVLSSIGSIHRMIGNMQNSMAYQLESLRLARQYNYVYDIAKAYMGIGAVYMDLKDYTQAVNNFQFSYRLYTSLYDKERTATGLANIGEAYLRNNQLDSALYYVQRGHAISQDIGKSAVLSLTFSRLGMIYFELKNYPFAYQYTLAAIKIAEDQKNIRIQCAGALVLSGYYQVLNNLDSAIYFAEKAYNLARVYDYKWDMLDNSDLLAKLYESQDLQNAYKYSRLSKSLNDSLYGPNRVIGLQKQIIQEQEIVKAKEAEALAYQNRLRQSILLAGLFIMGILGYILYHYNRQKHRANILLKEQKEQIESTLLQLKSTQSQLIQKEKLASLGELTAGIAHEIQNPLNFVNNFSEVSNELIFEIQEARTKNRDARIRNQEPREKSQESTDSEELEDEILEDIKQNLEKITHHGKRADAIVKGMLEHSRASSGEKIPTDINSLAEEYLRLSYHGMRAKDKSFNAEYKTDFDPNLPKINVVPQEMGRVLLNIINNAFQACAERSRSACATPRPPEGGENFTPTVKVSTGFSPLQGGKGGRVKISISDNGPGIPDSIKDKIFQPFFTTKPTGQGTGLGLSLSYDIVKAHGGEIKLNNAEGKGSEFLILLSIQP